jgi:DNA-binding transcriptional LysR family regulator
MCHAHAEDALVEKKIDAHIGAELLVVFDVAMRERSTQRSAVCLGLTELDLRSALQQLDASMGEPVFLQLGSRLTPTACADRLAKRRKPEPSA